jgi:hypothetical protein
VAHERKADANRKEQEVGKQPLDDERDRDLLGGDELLNTPSSIL